MTLGLGGVSESASIRIGSALAIVSLKVGDWQKNFNRTIARTSHGLNPINLAAQPVNVYVVTTAATAIFVGGLVAIPVTGAMTFWPLIVRLVSREPAGTDGPP